MRYFMFLFMLFLFGACNQQSQKEVKQDSVANINDTVTEIPASIDDTKSPGTPAIAKEPANKLIVGGKSIGNIELGMDDSLLAAFGKPDMSDAAMGKAWLTWYGKKLDEHNNKTQLNVYTTYNDTSMRSKTVQQIRTTSSFFKTAEGLHVYSSFNEIKQQYPALKKVAAYADDKKTCNIFDVQQQGIAFEIITANKQQICTGIIVHKPGIKVTQVYISLHPDMHIL